MSENILNKIENILADAAAGIKHDSQVLLNAIKELYAHHNEVANGTPAPPTPSLVATNPAIDTAPSVSAPVAETISGESTKE